MNTASDWAREPRASQLYKHLLEILTDSSPLSMLEYFIQFMESAGAVHLVQFWFCVQSFKSAVTSNPVQDCHTNVIENMSSTSEDSFPLQKAYENSTLQENSAVSQSHDISRLQLESDVKPTLNTDTLRTEVLECEFDKKSCLLGGSIGEPKLQCGQPTVSHCIVGNKQSGPDIAGDQVFTESDATGISISRQGSLYVVGDSLGIYSSYIALNAVTPLGIPDDIRQRVEVGICPENGVVDRSCFSEAQDFVFDVMERRYYPKFLQSPFLCKYQLEHISSGKLRLLDFLFGENALFYFMEYMEQENVSALLQFWLMAESFHTHMSSPSRIPNIEADTADAIVLYERYFSLQATEPLNMGYSVRLDVENRICDEKGPRVDSFAMPQQIAFDTMNKTYFPNFLESAIYLRFLNELIHTLKVSGDNSTCADSEAEVKSDLAEGAATAIPDALEDPSSIWRRPAFQMRLGYVDKFGQYVSEIEPPPPKSGRYQGPKKGNSSWRKTRIIDEEMAVRISRNIVTEVLNTLAIAEGWSGLQR